MLILFQHLESKAKQRHECNKGINVRFSLLDQKLMAVETNKRIQTMDDVCDTTKGANRKL
jgi:hypothetical protein